MNFSEANNAARQLFGRGLTPAERSSQAFFGAVKLAGVGSFVPAAIAGFQAGKSGPGAMVPNMIGAGSATLMFAPLAGAASAGLCLIPGVGPLLATMAAGLILGSAEERFSASISNKVRLFTDLHKRIRHLEMGGRYVDTENAQRLRMIAIQDMNAATIPGRRYLGQEALLMHR